MLNLAGKVGWALDNKPWHIDADAEDVMLGMLDQTNSKQKREAYYMELDWYYNAFLKDYTERIDERGYWRGAGLEGEKFDVV